MCIYERVLFFRCSFDEYLRGQRKSPSEWNLQGFSVWIRIKLLVHFSRAKHVTGKLREVLHCYCRRLSCGSGKCFARCADCLDDDGSCTLLCQHVICRFGLRLVASCTAGFGSITSMCRDHSLNDDRIALQGVPFVQLANFLRQQCAFVNCFARTHCVLHVQFVSCLLQKTFHVLFRSRHQGVIDMLSCFLRDVLSKWFTSVEDGTVVA